MLYNWELWGLLYCNLTVSKGSNDVIRVLSISLHLSVLFFFSFCVIRSWTCQPEDFVISTAWDPRGSKSLLQHSHNKSQGSCQLAQFASSMHPWTSYYDSRIECSVWLPRRTVAWRHDDWQSHWDHLEWRKVSSLKKISILFQDKEGMGRCQAYLKILSHSVSADVRSCYVTNHSELSGSQRWSIVSHCSSPSLVWTYSCCCCHMMGPPELKYPTWLHSQVWNLVQALGWGASIPLHLAFHSLLG